MGTRTLGDRPWLVVDEHRDRDIALRQQALIDQRDDVAWLTDAAVPAATAVLTLIETELGTPPPATRELHPLEAASLMVQDDLCLMHRRDGRWHLDASIVSFPTHWYLPDKVGRPVGQVHAPVNEYEDRIADKVTRLFDRLTERPVWRRNWGLTDTTTLYQPDRRGAHPEIRAIRVTTDLFIRSERQTLRLVMPDWILFTIRIQIEPLGELLTTPEQVNTLRRWVAEVADGPGQHRHLGSAQRTELLAALDAYLV